MLAGDAGEGTLSERFKRRHESPEARRFGSQLPAKLAAAIAQEGSQKAPITQLGESWATALHPPAKELLLGLYSAHGDRPIFTSEVTMNGSGEAADAVFREVLLDGMDPALFRAAPRATALAELAGFKAPAFDKLLGAGDLERLDSWWNESEEPRTEEGALALLLDPAASPLPHVAAAYQTAVTQRSVTSSSLQRSNSALQATTSHGSISSGHRTELSVSLSSGGGDGASDRPCSRGGAAARRDASASGRGAEGG